jgi:hypothetical protein
LKLNSKCYGPFKVLAKVRNTSYKLDWTLQVAPHFSWESTQESYWA